MRLATLILGSALTLIATAASADIITETYIGTTRGTDPAGFFGGGTIRDNTPYTAVFVFDTSKGLLAFGQTDLQGGPGNGDGDPTLSNPLVSASLTVNGKTYSPSGAYVSYTDADESAGTFPFQAQAGVAPSQNEVFFIEALFRDTDPVVYPLNANLLTSFTIEVSPNHSAISNFDIGGDSLSFDFSKITFDVTSTAAVPEPSTWAMLIIGFTGLGWLASRRKNGTLRSA